MEEVLAFQVKVLERKVLKMGQLLKLTEKRQLLMERFLEMKFGEADSFNQFLFRHQSFPESQEDCSDVEGGDQSDARLASGGGEPGRSTIKIVSTTGTFQNDDNRSSAPEEAIPMNSRVSKVTLARDDSKTAKNLTPGHGSKIMSKRRPVRRSRFSGRYLTSEEPTNPEEMGDTQEKQARETRQVAKFEKEGTTFDEDEQSYIAGVDDPADNWSALGFPASDLDLFEGDEDNGVLDANADGENNGSEEVTGGTSAPSTSRRRRNLQSSKAMSPQQLGSGSPLPGKKRRARQKRRPTTNDILKCPLCGENVASCNMSRHHKTKHSANPVRFQCSRCHYSTTRKDVLKRHERTVHRNNRKSLKSPEEAT